MSNKAEHRLFRYLIAASRWCAILLVFACQVVAMAAPDVFQEVLVSQRFFQAPTNHPIIKARTSEPATIEVLLYDWEGRIVASTRSTSVSSIHDIALASLPQVKNGIYAFALVAFDAQDRRLGVFPAEPGGGEVIQVRASTLNSERRQIEYSLPRAACVRIRAGFPTGPYLQPVLPWTPQAAGQRQVSWDGTSMGGIYQGLFQNPRLQVIISAVALPMNCLVDEAAPSRTTASGDNLTTATAARRVIDLARSPWPSLSRILQQHVEMPVNEDFRLRMDLSLEPASQSALLQVTCPDEERFRILNKRFEIMLFLDSFFVMEDERGLFPFNYRMSTRGIAPGKHALTVNVIDSDGRLGVVSQEISISP